MDTTLRKEYIILYLSPMTKYLGFIFFLLGLVGLTIIAFLLRGSDLDWNTFEFEVPPNANYSQFNLWLPYMIPGIAAGIFFIVGGIILIRYFLKRAKILGKVTKSPAQNATVISNIQNFQVKTNNVPRREVSFKTEKGSVHVFKFFSEHLAVLFKEGHEVPIIIDGEKAYPSPAFFSTLLGK